MQSLYEWGRESLEVFQEKARSNGCLVTQVLSGAKGSFEHLYQMLDLSGIRTIICKTFVLGRIKSQRSRSACENGYRGLSNASKIWEPDIVITKWSTIYKGFMWITKDV
ncbi:hypothetical protein TNCT_228201 [Trichonephila clavata]|uniref:Uncharacterized protein n=1 Tax=Trichonephila clavata TaxID=2740835 RepID=A0A8X6HYV6_TRICU|nr:hypothetical protein TNCT_228201 [Trichonephila clavata]